MAKGPNTKSRSLLYAGRGKEEEEEVRNITEARNLGREGEAEKLIAPQGADRVW